MRDAKKSREKIIQNAIELFSKEGYHKTSLDDIAKKSNINKAMIFYYYKSKAGLYEEVMSKTLSDIYSTIKEAIENSSRAKDNLKIFIETYAKYCIKYSYLPPLLLRELSSNGQNLPFEMRNKMYQLFLLLDSILKDGQKRGEFRENISIVIHFMITGTLNLFIVSKPLREDAKEFDSSFPSATEYSIEEICSYIYKTILKTLEV